MYPMDDIASDVLRQVACVVTLIFIFATGVKFYRFCRDLYPEKGNRNGRDNAR